MEIKKSKNIIECTDIQIGICILICLLLAHLLPWLQALAACTAAIMCTQGSGKLSWKSGLTRALGVITGGLAAVLVVFIDNQIENAYIFYLLAAIGIVITMICCRLVKMPYVSARVACISFVLIILLVPGAGRYMYALNRLIGTIIGALIAVLITFIREKFISFSY